MNSSRWRPILTVPTALILLAGVLLSWTSPAQAASLAPKQPQAVKQAKHVVAASNTAVLTYKYDNARTGETTNETTLTPANVNPGQFGKRMSYPVDGQIYAQPLYVPNLTINGAQHNVVFVATEHDSLYAFDADSTDQVAGLLWHTSFLTGGAQSPSNSDVACNDTIPEMGITGTPVIDLGSNTIYVVAFTKENGAYVNRLHAVDITTGQDRAALKIQATVSGSGLGSNNGTVAFDAQHERQRAGLLLANGKVYIAWGSFCDNNPYHGWLMSYSFDGTALHQQNVVNDTPDGGEGGIWGAGGAISADGSGNIYYISGNGSFDLNTGGRSSGDSFVKMNANLQRLDYFTPFNQFCLAQIDADLGSSGPLLVPTHNVIIGAGKEGRIYVINRSNMGHYNTIAGVCSNQARTNVDNVLQESAPGQVGGLFNTPSYWSNGANEYVYLASVNRPTGAYTLTSSGTFKSFTPTSQTAESFGFTGGNLVVSGNGTSNGVLWTIDRNGPTLRAYDATNLHNELYNSNQNPDRDALDGFIKFTCPTVANGQVFVPSSASLIIYGAVNGTTPPPPVTYNNAGIADDSISGHNLANYDGVGSSYSSGALLAAGITPGSSILVNGQSFIWPNLPAGTLDNFKATGQTVPIKGVPNATSLAFLGSATNGNTSGTATITYTDGTTQQFTLGFTDWAVAPPAFGNRIVATMTYRQSPTKAQTLKNYLFYTDVALQAGKTIKNVKLPATPTGLNRLHVFAFSTKGPLGSYNNLGTSDDSNTKAANFDGSGNSYSAEALQAQGCNPGDNAFFRGTTGAVFQWPAGNSGEVNNFIASGQTLLVNALTNPSLMAFAGSSTNGPSSGTATITYTDNSVQTFTLGMSDWTLNANKSQPAFGNQIMYSMPYRNSANGAENVHTYVFYTDVALQANKTLKSVTLPTTVNQGKMHIFAITTKSAVDKGYNNVGTSDDSNRTAANFDTVGYSYSANALKSIGITPWHPVTFNSVVFTWPIMASGDNNNFVASGQTVDVTPSSGATTLAFLGVADHGPSQGTFTVNFTDGTRQTFTRGFSDWTLAAGKVQPSFGNGIVLTSPYRNGPTGVNTVKTYVFYMDITVPSSKTVASVTLPATTNQGRIHVFAIGQK